MSFNQYSEPTSDLSQKTRTFTRIIMSFIEEAEAIDLYEQRLSVEEDQEALSIMKDAQNEEFKHFSMDLEFLIRQKENWKQFLQDILFHNGDIHELGDNTENKLKIP